MQSAAMWAAMLRTALTVLLLLLGAEAHAYPATQGTTYTWNTSPFGSAQGTASSPEAACEASMQALNWAYCSTGPLHDCGGVQCALCYNGSSNAYGTQNGCQSPVFNLVSIEQTGYTCPNGGTLSGSSCTCPAGTTDTGTACQAASCPSHQYHDGTACVNKCPAAGKAWNPLDHASTVGADGFSYMSGISTVCMPHGSGAAEGSCAVEPTDNIILCGDFGGGVSCYSEYGRYTGTFCSPGAPASVPDEVSTCADGDVWCKSNGSCASGFVAGTFNGETICVKKDVPVNVMPQPRSPVAPPVDDSVTNPPTWTDPAPRTGETNDPKTRTVIGVGGGANLPGTGGGTGGGGGGDIELYTCGLPGKPPCKIDETGTPTTGNFTTANTKLGEAETALKGLGAEVTKTDGKDTSWKISWGAPTGCTNPAAFSFPKAGINWVPDLCAYSNEIGGVMSFLWYLFTLASCLAMIRGTATGSA